MNDISFRKGLMGGALSTFLLWLALPGGGGIWPVLFVAVVPLLVIIKVKKGRSIAVLGLLTGLFHYCLQLYWIIIVLGRYGGLPWFFSLPAYLLLALYMATYFAGFLYLASILWRRFGGFFIITLLPALWVGLDWLRSFLFSGFPWMDLGYGLWQVPQLIQSSDLFGHYSATYLILVVNCLFFSLMQKGQSKKQLVVHFGGVTLLMCAVLLYGSIRLSKVSQEMEQSDRAVIGVVQGNIDQSRKWSKDEQQKTVEVYLKKSVSLLHLQQRPELIVWPETALPFFPTRNPLMTWLQELTKDQNTILLTGSPWFEVKNEERREFDFYNSAFMVTPQGQFGDSYYKSHLVPFGEYVPLKEYLPFLAPLVENVGDFRAGEVESPLVAGRIKSGVLICFESIFPDIGRKWVDSGANILVNLTNDAWYGRSSAPAQSMAMTVFRAVETRRSLVRAANTGISAFVDPVGRVLDSSPIFVVWAKSREMHLMDGTTFFVRWGYLFGVFCCVFSLLSLIYVLIGGKRSAEVVE